MAPLMFGASNFNNVSATDLIGRDDEAHHR